MSGDSSSSEKTEEPTPKKLRDARKKGQVSKSTDVVSTALIIAIFSLFSIGWKHWFHDLMEMILTPPMFIHDEFGDALSEVLGHVVFKAMLICIPFIGTVIIVGIFANIAQFGFLVSFEPLKPNFEKLNPISGFKKIFSKKNFFELLKGILKTLFLGILFYFMLIKVVDPLIKIPVDGINGVLSMLPVLLKIVAINVSIAYITVAAIDFFFQKKMHIQELKMTKDEVKREYKEMEGDPEIKGKRKQLHREMAMEGAVQKTKKSSTLITNPTHYAVAIYYKREEKKLPVVMAKGSDYLAHRMIKAAEEAGVPVIREVHLARTLFSEVEVNQYIPSDLIPAVAVVLNEAQRWKQEREGLE